LKPRAIGVRERSVGWSVQRGTVVQRGHGADRFIAHERQHVLVGRRASANQLHAPLQAKLLVLLHELQGRPTEQERVDRIDVPGYLREVGREVVHGEREPRFFA
jgi:hypothetical protein